MDKEAIRERFEDLRTRAKTVNLGVRITEVNDQFIQSIKANKSDIVNTLLDALREGDFGDELLQFITEGE